MKLIIFDVVGKKLSKKCKSIGDIINLTKNIIVEINDKHNETVIALVYETAWLQTNPIFINVSDLPKSINIDPITTDYEEFTIRIVEGDFIYTISKTKHDNEYTLSLFCKSNIRKVAAVLGTFKITNNSVSISDSVNNVSEIDNTTTVSLLIQSRNFVRGLKVGSLELKPAEYKPTFKHGRYTVKPSSVLRNRKPCLVSSHDRCEHFKVLRAPRYYKDGIVPKNEYELRRIPVKSCHVKRDIERVVVA